VRRENGKEGKKERKGATGRRRGDVGVLIAQKRPGAKTGALPDGTREPKPEADFPATTLQEKMMSWQVKSNKNSRNLLGYHK
jgi:hypothetical protein